MDAVLLRLRQRAAPFTDRLLPAISGHWPEILYGHSNVAFAQLTDLRAMSESVAQSAMAATAVLRVSRAART